MSGIEFKIEKNSGPTLNVTSLDYFITCYVVSCGDDPY